VRRLALFITGGAIWLLLLAIPAMADNGPHVRGQAINAATGSCASCHRAHSGQAPDLLKTSASTLCYSCHGAGGRGATTDVQDGMAYADLTTIHAGGPGALPAGGGALRGGGFDYALIATGTLAANPSSLPSNGSTLGRMAIIPALTTSAVATSAHSVDGSAVTMWGAGADNIGNNGKADVQLTCASCHDPHGNGQYRILKATPDDVVADTNVAAVKINDATVKSYTTTNYGVDGQVAADTAESPLNSDGSSINYTVATKTFQGTYLETSSRWCAMCHTRYFGVTGAAGNVPWMEDGSTDDTFTFRHATRNIVDPLQRGLASPLPAVINPITASSQVPAGSALGTAGTGASALRGVAVNPGTTTSAVIRASNLVDGQDGDNLATGAPRCITCHVSHGSNATAGSVVDLETSLVTGQTGMGSTLLRLDGRSVCQACHAK
jgi:predicted CXXCH cytochrome family protein